jgi:hypothetical protein
MNIGKTTKRRLATIMIVGSLTVGGATAFAASHNGSTSAEAATTSGSVTAAAAANGTGTGQPGGPPGGCGPGRGNGPGGYGRGRDLTVTNVNGNTITASSRFGQTVTVQVSATTVYTEAGATASLSDIHAGSEIAVNSSSSGTSATTIDATGITILLPSQGGVVTAVNGNTLTLTGFDGATHTVTVNATTRYQKAGQSATLSDISSGTAIVAEGTTNSDGSLTALRVTIQLPHLDGQVTAVNGTSYTVTGRSGQSYTIAATASTTYVNADGTSASASAVKTGTFIMAEGTLSSDGKTLTAQRITIGATDRGHGRGGFSGPGFGGFGGPGFGGMGSGTSGSTGSNTTQSTTGTQSQSV